eukprot:COSAG04_NODE_2258_length_4432_cov_1.870759_1_plen_170_part_00
MLRPLPTALVHHQHRAILVDDAANSNGLRQTTAWKDGCRPLLDSRRRVADIDVVPGRGIRPEQRRVQPTPGACPNDTRIADTLGRTQSICQQHYAVAAHRRGSTMWRCQCGGHRGCRSSCSLCGRRCPRYSSGSSAAPAAPRPCRTCKKPGSPWLDKTRFWTLRVAHRA